jgi:GTP-binding protein
MNADQVQPSSTDETAADESQVADALRAGLDDFDLSDEDLALLGRDDVDDVADDEEATRPVVAIIGRPNVGKSTLVNRIIGRREAVVEDVPGVTRDRVAYDGDWSGRRFTLVDTGGWEIDATGIHLRVAEQAEVAVDLADAVLFVVDATVGSTDDDEAVVKLLRRAGKPVMLIANKVDDQRGEADALRCGISVWASRMPSRRLHGRGTGDALDAMLDVLPEVSSVVRRLPSEAARAAWRSSAAPTSASPAPQQARRGPSASSSTRWRAPPATRSTSSSSSAARRGASSTPRASGVASTRPEAPTSTPRCARRRRWRRPRSPWCSSTPESISRAGRPDRQQVIDAGRALVIAYNKWDTLDEERRYYLEREIEREFVQVPWARGSTSRPRPGGTGQAGPGLGDGVGVLGLPDSHGATQRLSSARSSRPTRTRCVAGSSRASSSRPRPARARRASSSSPPGFLEAGYRRFLERRLREEFGFEGTPIEVSVRVREKRPRPLSRSRPRPAWPAVSAHRRADSGARHPMRLRLAPPPEPGGIATGCGAAW